METSLVATLAAVFVAVALIVSLIAGYAFSRESAASRRRLTEIVEQRSPSGLYGPTATPLAETAPTGWDRLAIALPTSRGSVKRLRRDLTFAGYPSAQAAALFSLSELVFPVVLAIPAFFLLTGFNRWLAVGTAVAAGYLGPNFLLARRTRQRQTQVQNGLADLLDLLVLCLEAGSGLDQAIVKASDELAIAYPAMAEQLQILISEMRAGKPRIEAFKGFASRTRVEDVQAMVSMLVQTDRFGTSIAQSLRTQADICRTKRRQRAEERAQKVSVKLVFPLVFCLFPALYVVLLGPAFIEFGQILGSK